MDTEEFRNLKVIDWSQKGNLVRLYLGAPDCSDYWGDDWDDAPYEHNAGNVYDRYIAGCMDVVVGFGYDVLTPSDLTINSRYAKEDFRDGVPFMVITDCDDIMYGYGFPSSNEWDDYVDSSSEQAKHVIVSLHMGMTVADVMGLCDTGAVTVIGGHVYYGGSIPAEQAPIGSVKLYDNCDDAIFPIELTD